MSYDLAILALLIVFVVLGAAGGGGFRMRGSDTWQELTGTGLGTARLVCWALPVGLLACGASQLCAAVFPAYVPLPWWGAVLLIGGLELGAVFAWWESLSLGDSDDDGPLLGQLARHTARGVVWGGAPALALWVIQGGLGFASAWLPAPLQAYVPSAVPVLWWPPLAAGAAILAPYGIGRWIGPPDRAVPNGELGFGALLGGAIGVSVCWAVLRAVG